MQSSGLIRITAAALCAIMLVGVAFGVTRAVEGREGGVQLVEALAADPKTDNELINWFAWEAAIGSESSSPLLQACLNAMLPRLAPDNYAHQDTVATLYHRLGQKRAAVVHELKAFDDRTDGFGASQALRFMLAEIDPLSIESAAIGGAEKALEVGPEVKSVAQGGRFFFAVLDGVKPVGLLVVGRKYGDASWPELPASLPPGRHPLVWADSSWGTESMTRLWPIDEKVKGYPPWNRLFVTERRR